MRMDKLLRLSRWFGASVYGFLALLVSQVGLTSPAAIAWDKARQPGICRPKPHALTLGWDPRAGAGPGVARALWLPSSPKTWRRRGI